MNSKIDMKRSELFFAAILVPIDYLMIVLAAIAAYFLRFETFITGIRPVVFELPLRNYLNLVLVIALLWPVIFILAGLYKMKGTRRIVDEVARVFLACSTSIALVIIIFFFQRELFSSRFIILAAWAFGIAFVIIARLLVIKIQRTCHKFDIGIHRVVLIENGKAAANLVEEFRARPDLGYKIVGKLKDFKQSSQEKLEHLLKTVGVDEVFKLNSDLPKTEVLDLVDFCNEHHLTFRYSADLFAAQTPNFEIITLGGVPIVEVKRTKLDGWGRIHKRIFDIIGSTFLIILTSPIMILTALAIKLDSRGPVFFAYQRIGQFGQPFLYFKFRSMIKDAHKYRFDNEFLKQMEDLRGGTPLKKFKNDPRITRVGKFIRKYSLDELPEFFNVLIGKMSLVGPRPHEPEEVAKYQKHHKRVLTLKSGVTGLAQISGRSDLDFEEEVRLDTYYIENWSIWFDLYILLKTPLALLTKRKAE